jgi:hypothetical protein
MIDIANDLTILHIVSSDSGLKFRIIVVVKLSEPKLAQHDPEYLSVTVGDQNATCSYPILGSSLRYNFVKQ